MKKILILALSALLLTGCMGIGEDKTTNTPTQEVEQTLYKYQTLNSDVVNQVNDVVYDSDSLTQEQQDKYKQLLTNNYRDLTYTVTSEKIDNDTAYVKTNVVVYDYSKAIDEFNLSYEENKDAYLLEDGTINKEKYNDDLLDALLNSTYKKTHEIEFIVKKNENKWSISDLTEDAKEKLSGFYNATIM